MLTVEKKKEADRKGLGNAHEGLSYSMEYRRDGRDGTSMELWRMGHPRMAVNFLSVGPDV